MIRIRAKRNGFRRAGVAHSDKWTEYPHPETIFTEDQLEQLASEPMLQIEVVPDPPADLTMEVKDDPTGEAKASGRKAKETKE